MTISFKLLFTILVVHDSHISRCCFKALGFSSHCDTKIISEGDRDRWCFNCLCYKSNQLCRLIFGPPSSDVKVLRSITTAKLILAVLCVSSLSLPVFPCLPSSSFVPPDLSSPSWAFHSPLELCLLLFARQHSH